MYYSKFKQVWRDHRRSANRNGEWIVYIFFMSINNELHSRTLYYRHIQWSCSENDDTKIGIRTYVNKCKFCVTTTFYMSINHEFDNSILFWLFEWHRPCYKKGCDKCSIVSKHFLNQAVWRNMFSEFMKVSEKNTTVKIVENHLLP